ncbi:hypothetical protein AAGW04_18290 [Pectobacterium aroidearum]|uniref:hypothetical protein n=1 Tax=Pectobacterium aroidearum TaxID=1201031 RepID=UPI0031586F42
MKNKIFWPLLLLPIFPAYSESLITCQPDSSDKSLFFVISTFLSLVFLGFINHFWWDDNKKFKFFTWRMPFIIITDCVVIYVAAVTFINIHDAPPVIKPFINKEMILSSPEVIRGAHYKSECIIISKNEFTVELSCKPDAAIESISLKEFASTLDALSKANEYIDDLSSQIRKTNICKPKN